MPGVYKKKICPVCSTEHRKRGPNCSRECSLIASKPKRSEGIKEWLYGDTDTAEEARWRINNYEEEPLVDAILEPKRIGDNQFIEDGDLWTEAD